MRGRPHITVVMPTYNQAQFIEAAVESVINQTYRRFTLHIVDDASTDDTLDKLRKYAHHNRVRVHRHQSNCGTGIALNTGFAQSRRSVYETWWASDNVMNPMMLETLSNYLNKNSDADFVYGGTEVRTMDASGLVEKGRKNIIEEVGPMEWGGLEKLLTHYHLGICWLWRTQLRLRAGTSFQEAPCEDYDMTLRMGFVGGQFAHIPEVLGWFRRHPMNMSNKIAGTDMAFSHKAAMRRISDLLERTKELRRNGCIVLPTRAAQLKPEEQMEVAHVDG